MLFRSEYDADGNVVSIRDHADANQARTVKYKYVRGELFEVTDVLGGVWKYEYSLGTTAVTIDSISGIDPNIPIFAFPLSKIIDPLGNTTVIDGGNRISKMTYPDNTSTTYEYEYDKIKKQFYVRRTASSGRVVENWYSAVAEGRRRDVNGVTVEKNWRSYINAAGSYSVRTTNELGQVTVNQYDPQDNLTSTIYPDGSKKTYQYGDYSRVLSETNENGVTTNFIYDTHGNRLSMTEAVGTPLARTTTYTYDQYGQMLVMNRPGNAKTTFTYDSHGNVATRTDSVDGSTSTTVTYLTYDSLGDPLEYRDGRNNLWKRTYDVSGKLTSLTNPVNETFSLAYDAIGNLLKVTNPANESIQFSYLGGRQVTEITDALGGISKRNYNPQGQLTTVIDPENKQQQVVYDAKGRLSQVVDGAGNTIKLGYAVTTQGATQDQISQITYPTFNQQFTYDTRGRRAQVITNLSGSDKRIKRTGYDAVGNAIEHVDATNRVTKYNYDALNRVNTITDPAKQIVKFVYDGRGNLLQVINQKGITIRSYEYDLRNRKTKEIWPGGETFAYTYDANNNLIEQVDAKGQITRHTYDAANRRIRSDYFASGSSTASNSVTFSYDTAGRLSGYDDGVTSAVYSDDALGRRISETINYGAFSKTFSTAYYKNGRKKGFTTPENTTYSYSYDAANRLAAITLPGQGTISFNAYNWFAPTSVQYPGGGVRQTVYDALIRPVRITSRDPAANATLDQQYTYDISGNITQKITRHGTYNYGYDVLDHLTSAKNPTLADEVYSYDATGNRITAANTTGNWQYNTNNQLLNDTVNTYDYDANGSQVKQTNTGTSEVREYLYNLKNRLSSFKVNSTVLANYYYDPFGRRIWKEVNGVRVYALYSQEGLIAEYDSTGVLKQNYGYIPGSTWGTQPLFTSSNGITGYYQLDQLGTPQQLTTTSGAVVWSAQYQAFGRASVTSNGLTNELRFPGQYYDSETGLHYNYFRYYDPKIGRYITADPIGLVAGPNVYTYVVNDPINFIDPLGLYHFVHGAKGPITAPTAKSMSCMDVCLSRDLAITSANDGTHSGPKDPHLSGQACDVGKNSNPGLKRDKVKACFNSCFSAKSSYGQEEGNHYHFQTRPGLHGSTGFSPGIR